VVWVGQRMNKVPILRSAFHVGLNRNEGTIQNINCVVYQNIVAERVSKLCPSKKALLADGLQGKITSRPHRRVEIVDWPTVRRNLSEVSVTEELLITD